MEEYFRAKAWLFEPELADLGVTNVGDPHGRLLFDASPIEMVGVLGRRRRGVEVGADRHAFTWRVDALPSPSAARSTS